LIEAAVFRPGHHAKRTSPITELHQEEVQMMRDDRLPIIAGVVVAILLTVAVPALAQPQRPAPRVPMPILTGQRDVELTNLARDIVVLRAINSLAMTKEQIQKLVPLLEQMVAADRRLREGARRQLAAERQRLLAGNPPPEESRRAMMALSDARREYQKEAEQVMNRVLGILSPKQGEKLKRIVAGGLGRAAASGPAAPRAAPPEHEVLRKAGLGPSTQALDHVIELLKEKLHAMSAS